MGRITLDLGTLIISSMTAVLGYQLVAQAFYAKVFAVGEGLLPNDKHFAGLFRHWNLEKGCITGLLASLTGFTILALAVWKWGAADFGELPTADNLRRIVLGTTLTSLGLQTIFSSFHLSVLGLKTTGRRPPSLE
jgi:hypothetical protein